MQNVYPQWDNEWSSPQIEAGVVSGWLNFQNNGEEWDTRLYTIDSLAFHIMQDGYSFTPQYVYPFTTQEKIAGNQIYSLNVDLTGDNITEFYVLAYDGAGSPFRQSFKILDITTNNILLEKMMLIFHIPFLQFGMLITMVFLKQYFQNMIIQL
jgi:hypothetical protein